MLWEIGSRGQGDWCIAADVPASFYGTGNPLDKLRPAGTSSAIFRFLGLNQILMLVRKNGKVRLFTAGST